MDNGYISIVEIGPNSIQRRLMTFGFPAAGSCFYVTINLSLKCYHLPEKRPFGVCQSMALDY
jgi:hypothetical protein